MTHDFDRPYWEKHWEHAGASEAPPNPHLVRAVRDLAPGRALDAGCGIGTEAIWLAGQGWEVTGADVAGTALRTASDRARAAGVAGSVAWVETDLSTWEPRQRWDLVTTHYAHPTIPQLDFYRRLAGWVAPGGSIFIVGHLHHPVQADTDGHPPHKATAHLADITALFDDAWRFETAQEETRTLITPGGREKTLHDVVVRAARHLTMP